MRQFRVRIIDIGELYYGRIGIYVSFSMPINRVGTTKLIDLVKLCNERANMIMELKDDCLLYQDDAGKRREFTAKEAKANLMDNLA